MGASPKSGDYSRVNPACVTPRCQRRRSSRHRIADDEVVVRDVRKAAEVDRIGEAVAAGCEALVAADRDAERVARRERRARLLNFAPLWQIAPRQTEPNTIPWVGRRRALAQPLLDHSLGHFMLVAAVFRL